MPQILKYRKPQAAPWQPQHILRRSPLNVGKIFHTQSAQHLVAKYLFKFPNAHHIYNIIIIIIIIIATIKGSAPVLFPSGMSI